MASFLRSTNSPNWSMAVSHMPLTELAAATAFACAWNRLDPEAFLELLAPDAHYASQWVFDELDSRAAIAENLRAKMKTVRN